MHWCNMNEGLPSIEDRKTTRNNLQPILGKEF
jgi:hypothetical protein